MKTVEYFLDYVSRIENGEVDAGTVIESEKEQNRYHLVARFLAFYIVCHMYVRRMQSDPQDNEYSAPFMDMLGALNVQGSCSLKKLCSIRDISTSTGSIMVNKMVEQGLVQRQTSADDRRKVILSLTEKGKAIADNHLYNDISSVYQYFKDFSDADVEKLDKALKTVTDILSRNIVFEKEE